MKISSVNQSFSSNCNFGSLSKINNRLNKYRKIKNCNKKSNLKLNNIINRTIANTKSIDKKYKFLIDGLYRDFRKIKSNTSKLLTKYKEWGFSSAKSIDEIVKTKEDMQLFHLKQKYFRHMKLFPKNKKSKRTNISMINTLKNNFDLFDLDEKWWITKIKIADIFFNIISIYLICNNLVCWWIIYILCIFVAFNHIYF